MAEQHRADSRLRRAWRETNRELSWRRPNWRKTARSLVSSWQRILTFIGSDRVIFDPGLPVESRASTPGWTGETPVSPCAVTRRSGFLLLSHRDHNKRIRQWHRASSPIFRTRFRRRAQVGGHREHLAGGGIESDGARTLLGRNVF